MVNHPKLVIVSFLAGTAILIGVLLSIAAPEPESVPPGSEVAPESSAPPFDPEIVPPPREVSGTGEQARREEPGPTGMSPDGEWLVVRGPEGGVSVRNLETGATAAELGRDAKVFWSPVPGSLAVITPDGGLRLLDLLADRDIAIRAHDGPVNSLEFDSRGERIVTGGEDGSVKVWDASTGENRFAVVVGTSAEAYWMEGEEQIAFAAEGRWGRIDLTNGRIVESRRPTSRSERLHTPRPEEGNRRRSEPGASSGRSGLRGASKRSPDPAKRPKKGK